MLTAHLTLGTLPGELYGCPIDVFWYTTEEVVEEELALRLDVAGADLTRVHVRTATAGGVRMAGGGLVVPAELPAIEPELRSLAPMVTVFDPLNGMLSADVDAHNAASVRRVMTALQAMCQRVDTTILGLGHLNKGEGGDLSSRQAGSAAFRDAARCVLMLGRDLRIQTAAEGDGGCWCSTRNLTEEARAITYTIEAVAVERGGRHGDITRMIETGSCELTARDLLASPRPDRSAFMHENIIEDAIRRELIDSDTASRPGCDQRSPRDRQGVRADSQRARHGDDRARRDHPNRRARQGQPVHVAAHPRDPRHRGGRRPRAKYDRSRARTRAEAHRNSAT